MVSIGWYLECLKGFLRGAGYGLHEACLVIFGGSWDLVVLEGLLGGSLGFLLGKYKAGLEAHWTW